MQDQSANKRALITYISLGFFALIIILAFMLGLSYHKKPSSAQQQLDQQQKALAGSAYADPILKYLPYGDIGYNITPVHKIINAKQVLVLVVSITLSGSDYKSSPADLQTTINAKEQAALAYIRSKGVDPAKYHIEYDVPAH